MWYLWRTTASAAPTASAVLAAATPDSIAVVQFMVILYYMYVCLPYPVQCQSLTAPGILNKDFSLDKLAIFSMAYDSYVVFIIVLMLWSLTYL